MSILSMPLGEGVETEPRGAVVDTATGAIIAFVTVLRPDGVRILYEQYFLRFNLSMRYAIKQILQC
jgi:hypothetical protein